MAAQRMGMLIDDLLKLARVSRTELVLGETDLSGLAQEIIDSLSETAPDRPVEAQIEPGLTAEADARLMRVALENLLGNAWKFTAGRSPARIAFGGARDEANGTIYYVRDNGAGFDMAFSGKLFGAFQRLHDTAEFPGTGIGLATAQRIIHKHGGRIWAEAAPGQGATFHFTL
jgi:light-regulated signal transduction histidine kinase (bacteriophytochrome)